MQLSSSQYQGRPFELTNSYRMAVKTQLYLCDIQGVNLCRQTKF